MYVKMPHYSRNRALYRGLVGLLAAMLLLNTAGVTAFHQTTPSAHHRPRLLLSRRAVVMKPLQETETPAEILALQASLAYVRNLPRSHTSTPYATPLLETIDSVDTPTYRRLFTHDTWKLHLGGTFLSRWRRCMLSTTSSAIVKAVHRPVLLFSLYAAAVIRLLPTRFTHQVSQQQLPLSLCGNAIGLLLVFRTNNAYNRLEEARELWGRVVYLAREIVANVTAGWNIKNYGKNNMVETSFVVAVCRYLAAFVWSLRDELRDGDKGCEILNALLPEDEARWVTSQRSRPMAIHGRLRRLIHDNRRSLGADHIHLLIENDLKDLALVAATCERIFSSPVPIEMSRHGLRSVTFFLLALPIVLAGSVPPFMAIAWSAVISFVYLGIDELGVQVEQPFQLIPLWQLCRNVQEDIEELVLHPLEVEGNLTMKVYEDFVEDVTTTQD
jgi:putative membrane protein